MIRRSLARTQAATFCLELPDPSKDGMPTPTGTGFFVSADGWFVTAAHVITENQEPNGPVRKDINEAWLMKETRVAGAPPAAMCQAVTFGHVIPQIDLALLKVDFAANASKAWLQGKTEFPFIEISKRRLDEGEGVYSFGYPLSNAFATNMGPIAIGGHCLSPRVTSAIVSSTFEQTRMLITGADPRVYVLDKALNYGNSGGPIVAVETGRVHALCSRFQPLFIPQHHIKDANGTPVAIMIPSLYGVVSSLGNKAALDLFQQLKIAICDE